MKAIFGLAAASLLLAPAAHGQAAPAQAAAPANANANANANAKAVEGVTVVGKRLPTTACGSHDEACIARVVAELKQRYPAQLRTWCAQVQQRAAMNSMMFMEVDLDRPLTANVSSYTPPPVTKTACGPDKKP